MNKLLVIFTIVIFGYIQVGYLVHYLVLRQVAKHEFEQLSETLVDNSSLDKFSLNDIRKDIEWEEDDKEFWLKGELYDVVKQTKEKGTTYLYCFNDVKEESIVEQYANSIRKRSDGSKHEKNLITFFTGFFINSKVAAISQTGLSSKKKYSIYSNSNLQQYKRVIYPPPKIPVSQTA